MVGTFGAKNLFAYYRFGPFLALYRAAIISFQVAKLTVWHFFLRDIHKRASKVIFFAFFFLSIECDTLNLTTLVLFWTLFVVC